MPKSKADLSSLIDGLVKTRRSRKEMETKVAEWKKAEDEAERLVIDALQTAKLESARSKKAQVTIGYRDLATVDNWPALYAHIQATGEFELLHKRVGLGACVERWDAKQTVPGVKRDREVVLKLSEVK